MNKTPDSVGLEVFSNALLSISEEMGAALIRTAYSTNIKERQDASTAIFDAHGNLIAQAEHIPLHLGAMLSIIRHILKRYPLSEIREGDSFLANDAYHGGGTHLADVTVASPVFFKNQLIGFAANMGHWPDLGGMKPGAASTEGCTEIFQEGIRIPPIKIFEQGVLQEHLFSFILLNVRFAEERPADLKAQIATNNLGIRRLQELCSKYGTKKFHSLVEGILEYTERTIRSKIRELPQGKWDFEDQLDDDSYEPGPVPLKVTLSIFHKPTPRMVFDFTGSSSQRTGGVNVVYEAVFATVAYVLKAILDPGLWSNAAFDRVIKLIAPKGSIVNPISPAAVGGRGTTCQRITDLILGVLAKVVPDRVCACAHGTTSTNFNGEDPIRKRRFVCLDGLGGGMGAMSACDGMDGVAVHLNNIPNLPTEVLETEYPIMIEKYELVPDSGGAGQYRGGLATRKDFRMKSTINFGAHSDRHAYPPWALCGGVDGAMGIHLRSPNQPNEEIIQSKGGPNWFQSDELLRVQTPGGGGYGNPASRDVNLLAEDLADGKVTEEEIRKHYPKRLVDKAILLKKGL